MLRKITVLKSDIEKGTKGNSRSCPIARAVRREFLVSKDEDVQVGGANLVVKQEGKEYKTLLPSIAKDFIKKFDESGTADPIEFTLALN